MSVAPGGDSITGGAFRPINRPRVLDRLAAAVQYRIAVLIAPAGFGKSVAVRQYLETVPSSIVYDVPSDAKTLVPFVHGFADAMQEAAPGMRSSLISALEGIRSSDVPGLSLAAWAATHVRHISSLIVIDDLHVGEGDFEISRFLATLIGRTREGPRWLLSSRTSLQLPITSWNAYGDSDLTIDAADLRFTFAEAKQSAGTVRAAVSDDELKGILEVVDGWPAALTFALRTSTRASDLRAVSASTRGMVYRYLAEQVWYSLDERLRTFLRIAAFLPRLETRLAVTAGFDDAAAIIESLRERVAFISILDTGVYKLHDLFRDFVQRQIQLEGNEALQYAIVGAARVLERAAMPGPALERYIDAHAVDEVVRVLADHNFALLEGGQYDVVTRALRIIPSNTAFQVPGILALRAAIEDAHGRVDQAARWFAAVLDLDLPDLPFRVSVAWRYALLEYQRRRLDALPILEGLAKESRLSRADRAQILGMLAMTYAVSKRPKDASDTIGQALALAEFSSDEIRARTYGRAANVAFYAGDEHALEHYSNEGARLAIEIGAFVLAARIFSTLSSQHHFAGRVDLAATYAMRVAANAENGGDPQMQASGLRSLIEMKAEQGEFERIEVLTRELAGLPYRGHVALVAEIGGRCIALASRGRFREAQVLMLTLYEGDLLPHQHAYRHALLALVSAGANSRAVSNDALQRFAECTTDESATDVFVRLRTIADRFIILTNIALGRNVVAGRLIRALRSGGEFQAFDTALLAQNNNRHDRLIEALRAMRLAGQAGFASLIEAVGQLAGEEANQGDAVLTLTCAEIEILKSMAQGLSNQAIADEQRRAINTVRTHVSSILRKLRSSNRGEAVAAARRRGLV